VVVAPPLSQALLVLPVKERYKKNVFLSKISSWIRSLSWAVRSLTLSMLRKRKCIRWVRSVTKKCTRMHLTLLNLLTHLMMRLRELPHKLWKMKRTVRINCAPPKLALRIVITWWAVLRLWWRLTQPRSWLLTKLCKEPERLQMQEQWRARKCATVRHMMKL